MLREQPMMSLAVLHCELPLAIHSHVEILDNPPARRLHPFKLHIHIVNKHGQRLRPTPNLRPTPAPRTRTRQHHPRLAQMNLRALYRPVRPAIAVVLNETESGRKPSQRIGHVLINDVRQDSIRRRRTILQFLHLL